MNLYSVAYDDPWGDNPYSALRRVRSYPSHTALGTLATWHLNFILDIRVLTLFRGGLVTNNIR